MEKTSRQEAERSWHDEHFDRERALVVSDAVKARYGKQRRFPVFPREALFHLIGDVRGKKVLAFGCGDDSMPHLLDWMGADVTAFDLSATALAVQAKMRAVNASQVKLAQAAAEDLPFAKHTFDLVIGTAILHHLPDALAPVPNEVRRVLRTGGRGYFIEPINFSRGLASVRKRVPVHSDLSPGERQLTEEDLRPFGSAGRRYFRLLARLDRLTLPSGNLETAPAWRKVLTVMLHWADWALLSIRPMQRFAGTVLLELRNDELLPTR